MSGMSLGGSDAKDKFEESVSAALTFHAFEALTYRSHVPSLRIVV